MTDDDVMKMILEMLGGSLTNFMDENNAFDIDTFIDKFIEKCIRDKNVELIEVFKEKYPEKFI